METAVSNGVEYMAFRNRWVWMVFEQRQSCRVRLAVRYGVAVFVAVRLAACRWWLLSLIGVCAWFPWLCVGDVEFGLGKRGWRSGRSGALSEMRGRCSKWRWWRMLLRGR